MPRFEKKVLKAVDKLKPTDWNTATQAGLSASDFKALIGQKLDDFKFRPSAPIRAIIKTPTDLRVATQMSNSALLVALMDNMYRYGRVHWKWVRGSPQGAMDAFEPAVKVHIAGLDFPVQQRWKMGRGLLDGTVDSAVCGSFNSAFRFIAMEIFNVPGVVLGTADDNTQIPEAFITLTGRAPIDSAWHGNVWYIGDKTDLSRYQGTNRTIRALRFKGHYFVHHGGTIYDVTGNATYKSSKEMVWCYLDDNAAKMKDFPGTPGVFNVKVQNPSNTTPAAKYCVGIGEEPGDRDRFSNWILTDRESLTAQEMSTLSRWSSVA